MLTANRDCHGIVQEWVEIDYYLWQHLAVLSDWQLLHLQTAQQLRTSEYHPAHPTVHTIIVQHVQQHSQTCLMAQTKELLLTVSASEPRLCAPSLSMDHNHDYQEHLSAGHQMDCQSSDRAG